MGARLLAGIVAVGVLVRFGTLALVAGADLQGDEISYTYLALLWDRFGFYSATEHYLWPPLYPAFLAACFRVFQESGLAAARILQVLASGVVGTCVMLMAARAFDRRAAVAAGVAWAVFLPLLGYPSYVRPETMLLTLLVPALLLLWTSLDSPQASGLRALAPAAAGLLAGLAFLVKESVLLVVVLGAAALLLGPGQGPFPRRITRAALLALAAAVVVLPWALRNQEVYERPVLSGSTLGHGMFYGLNAQYVNFDYGWMDYEAVYDRTDWRYRWFLESPGPMWRLSRADHVITRSAEDVRQGLDFARRHPGWILRTRIKKIADTLTPLSFLVRDLAFQVHLGAAIPSAGARGALAIGALLMSGAMLLTSVPGLVLGLRGSSARIVFAIGIASFAVTFLLVGMSRYRVPIDPLLLVASAGFLTRSPRRWAASRGAVALAATGVATLLLLWWVNRVEIAAVLTEAWR